MGNFASRLMALTLILGGFAVAPSHADLLITPQRVVFEDRQRTAIIGVVNRSNQARTYDLGWTHMRMDEDGNLVPVDDETGGVASFVVLSPRRITLEPGQHQTIRLAVRRPANLPEGEYRSHLELRAVEMPDDLVTGGGSADGVGAQVKVLLGFTLPVIVRHGSGDTDVAIQAQNIDYDANRLSVRVDRQGPFSTYGNMHVFWRPEPSAQLTTVGRLDAVAVYPEVAGMNVSVPLTPERDINLGQGEIFVYYVDPSQQNAVLAETGARL